MLIPKMFDLGELGTSRQTKLYGKILQKWLESVPKIAIICGFAEYLPVSRKV